MHKLKNSAAEVCSSEDCALRTQRTDNGDQFLKSCESNHFLPPSTDFRLSSCRMTTWHFNSADVSSQTDQLAVAFRCRCYVQGW